ncbi:MAG TPA: efflux RND transporter periplasmic adaptor subunit [Nitrospirota bacterium]|nr:efflux RND transporter periplasmic adaptor subunit [Nitrospirota bacterium]
MSKEVSTLKGARRLFISGVGLVALALVLLLVLFENRRVYLMNETRDRQESVKAGQEVRVIAAKRAPRERLVSLTGDAQPYATVILYAKVSGYLKKIMVDKGDRVNAGQVLAVIESPELDRQYDSAVVDAQDKRRDATREKTLVEKNLISQQDADHAEAAALEAEANAESLRTQKEYEIIRAPFSGTVTARFADPGALVQSAATSQTTALPVVSLSQTDRLRVYIYLAQKDAAVVRIGNHAEISDSFRPNVKLSASITRISGELDPKTRTLLTELDVDNKQGLILAGSFVQVSVKLKTAPAVEIPADALLLKGEQAFVAVVSADGKVKFRPVVMADSDGKVVRLSSGLDEGERVIRSPGFALTDNEQVQPLTETVN